MDAADPIAQFDQLMEASKPLALAVRRYYEGLVSLGFDEKAALELASNYQSAILLTSAVG